MNESVVLAFDFGTRRTGVAIANTLTRAARPLQTIAADTKPPAGRRSSGWSTSGGRPRSSSACRAIRMALRMSSPRAASALRASSRGATDGALPEVDERYSSAVSTRAPDVDAEAAALILQQWLDEARDA